MPVELRADHATSFQHPGIIVKRIPELDALRGLAAVGVVLFHAFPHTFYWGWSCVDLFFVLSGYLITTIILRERNRAGFLQSFYLRRVSRIWPVYYLTLCVVLIVNWFSRTGYSTAGLGWHLFFLQNISQYWGEPSPPFINSFGPSWSVAIEEQFYLFWPLCVLPLGRLGVPILSGFFLTACVIGRIFLPDSIVLLFTRGDGLAFGCFLAWLLQQPASSGSHRIVHQCLGFAGVIGAGYLAVYLVVFYSNPHPGWPHTSFMGFGLFYFALIGTCVVYTGQWFLAPLRNTLLQRLGTISYAMYLFHQPVFHYTPRLLGILGVEAEWLQAIITWLLIIVLPIVSWFCLERPIIGLRHSGLRTEPAMDQGLVSNGVPKPALDATIEASCQTP